jgi:hypothetical protein
VQDNGGTTGGGVDLDPSANTITFNVTAVNDAPTFAIVPPSHTSGEDAGAQSVAGFVTSIDDGDPELAQRFTNGAFFNLYLSPQDYHHVHTPVGGKIVRSVHIPGMLWPVNDWSLANVNQLFSINERVVTYIECALGLVAVVMIGATNVGKISVVYDTFISNAANIDRTVKKDLYSRVFRTAEYFLYDLETARLDGFRLAGSAYEPLRPNAEGRLWSEQLGLELGIWQGIPGLQTVEAHTWLRLFYPDGRLAPTATEAERQRADAERARADAAVAEVARLRVRLGEI